MRQRKAFTLVELLVVISIIVILVGIMVPSMERALASSQRSKCLSNLNGIGKALGTYLSDSLARVYPKTAGLNGEGWFMLFGKVGDGTADDYSFTSTTEPDMYDPTKSQDSAARPLNKYLGFEGNGAQVKIAECPSDAGVQFARRDFTAGATGTAATPAVSNCYNQLGSSYISAFKRWSGIEAAFGANPMQAAAAKPPSSKVLVADAPIYGQNKWAVDRKNRWHSTDKANRQHNILFADYHAELFSFGDPARTSTDNIETPIGNNANDINPSRGFW
jgi:prepilin-type N-terminal cleavage/methylation domain-containing protein